MPGSAQCPGPDLSYTTTLDGFDWTVRMTTRPADLERRYRYGADCSEYTLAVVTDEDHASQVELADGEIAWQATLRYDRLYRWIDPDTGRATYTLEPVPEAEGGRVQLTSLIAEGGRRAEFSELARFGRHLLTFDDRTGLVCEIRSGHQLIPRQISNEAFDEPVDERDKGANTLIEVDEAFGHIRTIAVGERVPERGVSSFKLIPGHPDECVGLKSVEIGDRTETWLFCFDLDGNVLTEDTFLGAYKCEGVEIV